MLKFRLIIFGFAAWLNFVGFFSGIRDAQSGAWVLSLMLALLMCFFFSKAWAEYQAQDAHEQGS